MVFVHTIVLTLNKLSILLEMDNVKNVISNVLRDGPDSDDCLAEDKCRNGEYKDFGNCLKCYCSL